mmetsp:Transcript_8441/g.20689  ORF Transcript_8441/g.20689 Transcript_8441/m.20689 type:complete len:191 (+) Transcript_8441:1385-1957(+)
MPSVLSRTEIDHLPRTWFWGFFLFSAFFLLRGGSGGGGCRVAARAQVGQPPLQVVRVEEHGVTPIGRVRIKQDQRGPLCVLWDQNLLGNLCIPGIPRQHEGGLELQIACDFCFGVGSAAMRRETVRSTLKAAAPWAMAARTAQATERTIVCWTENQSTAEEDEVPYAVEYSPFCVERGRGESSPSSRIRA